MDLSGLQQSLHRLALLEDGSGVRNPSNNGVSISNGVFNGGLWQDDGSPQQLQNQQVDNHTNGNGTESEGEGKKRNLKSRHDLHPDPIVALLHMGEGGGIRVYDNEGDEWDLSSSNSGKREILGHQKFMSKKSPLMRLRVLMNGVTALLCVSMGSNINILKPEIAKRARLSLIKVEPPTWVSLDIGNGPGTRMPLDYQVLAAPYQIDDFFAQDNFFVTPALTTSYVDGIMGIDWLEKYKPTVNYRLNRIELIDLRGRVHIIESVPGSERAGRGENETQWITARMWDWDLKTMIHGQQYQPEDVYSLEAID